MIRRHEIAQSLPRDFVHVVTGVWETKAIHIDGEVVTVAMLRERVQEEEKAMTDAYNDYQGAWGLDLYEHVEAFDWGRVTDGAHVLSLAWIFWLGAEDVHDFVFRREIEALPCADFTYQYPRIRIARDKEQGEAMFAEDFQRGMGEMGAMELGPHQFPESFDQ